MKLEEATYVLVYRGDGIAKRRTGKGNTPFRYRIWMGKGIEPICLVVLNRVADTTIANRFAIHRAALERLPTCLPPRIRYFECVITSKRLISEVYFSPPDKPLSVPSAELRSLAYLEGILGLQVSVI